ncbi:MAG: cell division protein FtsZ [Candidatus Hydrogenedentes bacterium]|nr:cell division protein FtsZ [Candidatus Hydrogenedentota bacterium]
MSKTIGTADEFQSFDQRAVIKVCGIGGGGGNAVNRMIDAGLSDVEFIAINTDAQALKQSRAGTRLQVGAQITNGLGSGAIPDIGKRAAEEDRERIREVIRGADMVFLTIGLGGGTGTGASPIVAEEAADAGALTVAIVTLPFGFENRERMNNALAGLRDLEEHVDSLIVVPNDRVADLCRDNISLLDAFRRADEVLHNGVRAVTELITVTGLVNADFNDVRTIMQAKGRALMGIGVAEGDGRAIRAAEEAIVSPLLEQSTINGAKGVLVNVRGGCDMRMREVEEAVNTVKEAADPNANIIVGVVVDDVEHPELQVTVIAAGFPSPAAGEQAPGEASARPRPVEVAASAPKPAPKPEPVKPAPQLVIAEPEEQFLFPEERTMEREPQFSGVAEQDSDEDFSIPAFLRKRMKKRAK